MDSFSILSKSSLASIPASLIKVAQKFGSSVSSTTIQIFEYYSLLDLALNAAL